MNLEEIRNSGLLESYIIGILSAKELEQVKQYLTEFPELSSDLSEIQRSLRAYAEINGVEPRPELRSEIIKSITGKSVTATPSTKPPKSGGLNFLPLLILGGLLIGTLIWGFNQFTKVGELQNEVSSISDEYSEYQRVCDSLSADNAELRAMLTTITNPGNRIIQLTPTGNFAGTNLYLHLNQDLQLNYIQALTLPSIAADQAFQLWSLKDGQNPIPLTVFASNRNQIFPVDFEEGTGTYAITIEQAGGADSPNLEQLIGTIKV